MARRSGLGRGLGALIPNEAGSDDSSVLRDLPISQIVPNPHQPRRHFDEERLGGLTASVRELGVLQPVLVRSVGDDRYELIAGERRWRAAREAGMESVPALVREADDRDSLLLALVENVAREGLSPVEEARGYAVLVDEFGLALGEVAQRVGRSRPAVSNRLRLLELPGDVLELGVEGMGRQRQVCMNDPG